MNDVTDQITDEKQFDEMKTTEQRDPCDEQDKWKIPDSKQNDQAMEAQNMDIDSEAQNIPWGYDDEDELRSKEQESEEVNHEREEGSVELNKGGKLDDKMWNGPDHEDETCNEQDNDFRESGLKKQQEVQIEADGGVSLDEEKETVGQDNSSGSEKKNS